jgi:glycerol transport system permease protein
MTTASVNVASRQGLGINRVNKKAIVMVLYLLFLLLPIYWLINMSLKTNAEILGDFTSIPGT